MYDADEVDAYVDDLRARLARVLAESRGSSAPSSGDGRYERGAELVGRTLLLAQQVADETISHAYVEARAIIARARMGALELIQGGTPSQDRDHLEAGPARGHAAGRRSLGLTSELPSAMRLADDDYFADLRRALEDDYPLGPVPDTGSIGEPDRGRWAGSRSLGIAAHDGEEIQQLGQHFRTAR